MSNITISADEFIAAVVKADRQDPKSKEKNPVDLLIASKFKPRDSGGGINPSIPARLNRKTGKIVLMDIITHSKEVGKVFRKGLIPLELGYIYIDDEAYKTLQGLGSIPGAPAKFDDAVNLVKVRDNKNKLLSKITSAPNALMGLMKKDPAIEVLKTTLEQDPFYVRVKKKTTHYIIARQNLNAQTTDAKQQVLTHISRKKVPNLYNQYQTILVYFSPANKLVPNKDSVLFELYVKAKNPEDTFITLDNYEFSNLIDDPDFKKFTSTKFEQLSQVKQRIQDTAGAGHLEALKTMEAKEILAALEKLQEEPAIKADPRIYGVLSQLIETFKEDVKDLESLDRFFGQPEVYFDPNLSVFYENLKTGANQLGMGVNFVYKTQKGLKARKGNAFINFLLSIKGVSTPESALINSEFKGTSTLAIITRMKSAWTFAAAAFAERVAEESLIAESRTETSHSLIQSVLITMLGNIFGINTKNKITLKRNRNLLKSVSNNYKKNNISISSIPRLKTIKLRKQYSKSSSFTPSRSSQSTQNIVPLINAELKRYVIEEMSYPSLENRSGRFAASVRVLSAQENAAVQYTYQKSPYQVFSPSRGKRPWATEERDPAKIIDRAIKRIGQDRFQKVFRTEEI